MRKQVIFGLTHFYPLFIAGHLYFLDWCKKCQLLFNVVPIIVFGGLILTWKETGHIGLDKWEKFYLKYFLWNLAFIYCYYCICVIAPSKWVYDKNVIVSAFLLITFMFYLLHYEPKRHT